MRIYTYAGNCNLERCGVVLQELGKLEDDIFRNRKQKEEGMARARARRDREAGQSKAAEARAAPAKEAPREAKKEPKPDVKPADADKPGIFFMIYMCVCYTYT